MLVLAMCLIFDYSVSKSMASVIPVQRTLELTIPAPWGHISAKTFGDPCSKPVLAVHGLQDNAGSFERLIPLLPTKYFYVCIDLPGHGLSSRLPKGFPLDMMSYIRGIHTVVRYLKWNQFYYIGHSFGGRLGTYYAGMFPNSILKLVVLDATAPTPVKQELYLKHFTSMTEKLINLENKLFDKTPPSYSYEEALNKLIKNRPFKIKKEAAEALLQRSLKKSENGYYFSTDQRLKFMVLNPITPQLYLSNLSKITCDFLLIMTKKTYKTIQEGKFSGLGFGSDAEFFDGQIDKKVLKVFIENKNFKAEFVDGDHDVHNNEPEIVAPLISKWLCSYQRSSL